MTPSKSSGRFGLPTIDKPCPQCGETGHERAMVLGLVSILCPNVPFGEIRAATPSENTTVGVDSEANKAPRRRANDPGHGNQEGGS